MSTAESPQLGLRERKKEQTRQLIAETARRLFSERGFERVTVAEIARTAEVSEQTVFNYFPTKEDLVYWRLQSFEDELLRTIREREPGEPALAAFGRFILAERGLLGQARPPGPRGARGAHADDQREPRPTGPRAADLRQLHRLAGRPARRGDGGATPPTSGRGSRPTR